MQSSLPTRLSTIGLLLSGGLDSSILLAHLLAHGNPVQPFYIRSGLVWQEAELRAVRRFLPAADNRSPGLVVLDLPLDDLYGQHWSITGDHVPDETTPDEAVYLPGRNALLLLKAAVWCQLHGIQQLALAPLAGNPFADATDEFFTDFQAALRRTTSHPLAIVRPFARFDKRHVMELGRHLPLELTFSCISPVGELHCGHCNKCAERKEAFRSIGLADRTTYALANGKPQREKLPGNEPAER